MRWTVAGAAPLPDRPSIRTVFEKIEHSPPIGEIRSIEIEGVVGEYELKICEGLIRSEDRKGHGAACVRVPSATNDPHRRGSNSPPFVIVFRRTVFPNTEVEDDPHLRIDFISTISDRFGDPSTPC
jgi:hypothetical protein